MLETTGTSGLNSAPVGGLVERRVEGVDDRRQPVDGAGVGLARGHAGLGTDRRDDGDLVPDRVEDDDDGRADHDGVGEAERVRVDVGQRLHLAHHVVAEIAEDAGRHGRQLMGQMDVRFRDDATQRLERRLGHRLEAVAVGGGIAVDLGLAAGGAEDQVRLDADDRIAAAHGAALDRFEQEAVGAPRRQLEHGRDRRLQVGDHPRPHHLRLARVVGAREVVEGGFDQHGGVSRAVTGSG